MYMHDTTILHARHHDITYMIPKHDKIQKDEKSNATVVFSYLIANVIGFCFTIAFCSCMHVLACKTFMYHLNKIKLK